MGYERVPERSAACPEDLSRPQSVSLFALQFMYMVALTLAVGVGSQYRNGLLSTSRWRSLTHRYAFRPFALGTEGTVTSLII